MGSSTAVDRARPVSMVHAQCGAAQRLQRALHGKEAVMTGRRALSLFVLAAAAGAQGIHAADRAEVPIAAAIGKKGCWARIYKETSFKGDALVLLGPIAVAYVETDWGFSWDPQFRSLTVGPAATFTVFDNFNFGDRTATFAGGQQIADLDEHMGIFRTVRSMRLTCR